MERYFLPHELLIKLTELDFKCDCLATFYNKGNGEFKIIFTGLIDMKSMEDVMLGLPLWEQVFEFFRNKYNYVGNVYASASGYLYEIHHTSNKGGSHQCDSSDLNYGNGGVWDTFEEARKECVIKLIEISKK